MTMLFNDLPNELKQRLEALKSATIKNTPEVRGERITNSLDQWLLDDEQKQLLSLNPWNIFFLGAAAYLFEVSDKKRNKSHACCGHIPGPDNPSDVSSDLITRHRNSFGINDEKQAGIIALICSEIKNNSIDSDSFYSGESIIYDNAPINIALLTGAVLLAAELDLTHPKTSQGIAAHMAATKQIPFELFHQSYTLTSVGKHAFLPGTIQVQINCCDPEVHRALKHHESLLQRLLHHINSQVSPRFLFSEIIFEIVPTGYTPLDMKFSVDSTAALQLFTGNRLYSDKRVFLRELIQNAVDACNLKKLFDANYTPHISIEFDDQIQIIKFRDNGIGMDRQWIEKYFLKIGISFYQSGDMKSMNQNRVDFNFISKFGIGFLSSFLVSDKIVIKTRKGTSPGLLITITNLQDYFDVRFAPNDCAVGTEVTLYLTESKINYCRSIEFIGYLKTNIRYLTIPVELFDHESKSVIIGHEKLEYDKDDYSGCSFVASLNFKDSKGYLFLRAIKNLNELFALEPARGGISIFQDGIFVTQTDSLLPEGARGSIIGRINLTGKDKCELSMDRNRIFWTEQQLQNIKRLVRLGIIDLANQLLTDTQTLSPPLNISQTLINQLAIFFNFNEIDDEMYRKLGKPIQKIIAKQFRDFIRVNVAHTHEHRDVPEADGYGEKWQQNILESFAKRSRPPLPES